MPQNSTQDHPGVRIPPPLIFAGCLLLGIWLNSAWIEGELGSPGWTIVGGLVAAFGTAIVLLSIPSFFKYNTSIEPWMPASAIISDGIYGWSRNPIYLGMAIGTAGMALAAVSWTGIAGVVIAVVIIRYYVIAREERYLEARFGEEYLAYKAKVRRWL